MSSNKYVVDKKQFQKTGVWLTSLAPASKYKAKDIGKSFFPVMNMKPAIKVPMTSSSKFYMAMSGMRATSIPSSFNWTSPPSNVPVMVNKPQNQGACGTCWAVSTASAIGDHWAIALAQKGQKAVAEMLSANNFSNCIPGEDCQNGGLPSDAAQFTATNGIVSDQCWQYSCDCTPLSQNPPPPDCLAKDGCKRWYVQPNSITNATVVKGNGTASSVSEVDVPATIKNIQMAIMTNGPVVSGFAVPADFMSIGSDPNFIFKTQYDPSTMKDQSQWVGWHAICLVGWGNDASGKLYWIIRNSWGAEWGNGGYCKAYAYPENHIGLDVPLFDKDMGGTLARINLVSLLAVKGAKSATMAQSIRRQFGDPPAAPGNGGVTLFKIDMARSPQAAATFNMMTKMTRQLSMEWDKKKVFYWVVVAVFLVTLGYLIMKYLKQKQMMDAVGVTPYFQ
jgi:C1A family cysteine protease